MFIVELQKWPQKLSYFSRVAREAADYSGAAAPNRLRRGCLRMSKANQKLIANSYTTGSSGQVAPGIQQGQQQQQQQNGCTKEEAEIKRNSK